LFPIPICYLFSLLPPEKLSYAYAYLPADRRRVNFFFFSSFLSFYTYLPACSADKL
jgi:hypothetical protein